MNVCLVARRLHTELVLVFLMFIFSAFSVESMGSSARLRPGPIDIFLGEVSYTARAQGNRKKCDS